VDVRRVLADHHRLPLLAAVAELGDRGRAVGEQPLAVGRVAPGASDDPRPVLRTDVVDVQVDDGVDRVARHDPLLDQQRLERPRSQLRLARRSRVVVAVLVVVVLVVMVVLSH
jgi:hypothetical protein